jgi:hypothetical protein
MKSSIFVDLRIKEEHQQTTKIMWGIILGLILMDVSGSSVSGMVNLNIVIPGYIGFKSLASMSNNGPAVDTGVSQLKIAHPFLNITKTYLLENTTDCNILKSGVQNQLAKWYYQNHRESDVDVIITTGKL